MFRGLLFANKKGIKLRSSLPSQSLIYGDHEKLSQVLSNVLSNAIKFSDGGTIEIRMESSGRDWTISIHDEGRGIPAAHLEQIFERFFQGRHAAKGSGIGLTIAKAWVEAHGGKIWAESEGEGKGATVTFTLPVDERNRHG